MLNLKRIDDGSNPLRLRFEADSEVDINEERLAGCLEASFGLTKDSYDCKVDGRIIDINILRSTGEKIFPNGISACISSASAQRALMQS